LAKKIRVLIAKLGLDTHTIGITVVAQALRDAGMEVIFTGLKQTPEMVVQTGDKLLIAGGVIPGEEVAELKQLGFAEIFTMGARTSAICRFVSDWWAGRS
jgi:methylmalonyl-CoA mutase C-terminal domain/subunit